MADGGHDAMREKKRSPANGAMDYSLFDGCLTKHRQEVTRYAAISECVREAAVEIGAVEHLVGDWAITCPHEGCGVTTCIEESTGRVFVLDPRARRCEGTDKIRGRISAALRARGLRQW